MKSKALAGAGLVILGLWGLGSLGSDSPSPAPIEQFVPSAPNSFNVGKQEASTRSAAPAQNCDLNYSGCLNPNASDYDCAEGTGNGPYYTGRVQVLGYDKWDLDRDGDGWGCDN